MISEFCIGDYVIVDNPCEYSKGHRGFIGKIACFGNVLCKISGITDDVFTKQELSLYFVNNCPEYLKR